MEGYVFEASVEDKAEIPTSSDWTLLSLHKWRQGSLSAGQIKRILGNYRQFKPSRWLPFWSEELKSNRYLKLIEVFVHIIGGEVLLFGCYRTRVTKQLIEVKVLCKDPTKLLYPAIGLHRREQQGSDSCG
jgi:hypothetical protein